MKNLKFKRYNVGEVFDPSTAETETIHLVPVSVNPLIVKAYDVDEFGNVAEIVNDKWVEERETVMTELSKLTPATLTEENSLNKVVKTVHWRYRGTDETSGISTIKSILGIV